VNCTQDSPGNISCEMARDGWCEVLPAIQERQAFEKQLREGSAPAATIVTTSSWSPTASTFDVSGAQPLVIASFLRALSETASVMVDVVTFQVNGCYLDLPAQSVTTEDGTRIWFTTPLRDFSGDTMVGVQESAALKLACVSSKDELMSLFADGALQFGRSNIRGGRRVQDGRVQMVVVDAERVDTIQAPTGKALALYDLLKLSGRTSGGIIACKVADLAVDTFAGLRVQDLPVKKALVFVQGLERGRSWTNGQQRKYSEEDSASASTCQVVSFCHENYIADYKFDTGRALVLVTGLTETPDGKEILAEHVTTIIQDQAAIVRAAMTMEMSMANKLPIDVTPVKATSELAEMGFGSSSGAKRCRLLTQFPSDPA
jgi:hypothetical protein